MKMKKYLRGKVCLSVIILIISFIVSKSSFGQTVVTVVEGDTLWATAHKYMGAKELWPILADYNQLKNPHLIYPGDKIKIPSSSRLTITETFGQVEVKKEKATKFVKYEKGMLLEAGDEIKTYSNSRTQIEIDEKSFVQVKPNTTLKIVKLLSGPQERDIKTRLKLFLGRLFFQEQKKTESGFEIETPGVICGVRGTQFEAIYGEDNISILAVFDGKVSASAKGKSVEIPAGYASKAVKGQAPSLPIRLPSPPVLLLPENGAVISIQNPTFNWQAVPEASRYHFELSRDIGFNQVIWEVEGTSSLSLTPFTNLPPDDYYWHVSSINQQGIEGAFSQPNLLRIIISKKISKKLEVFLIPDPPIYKYKGINFASTKSTFRLVPANIEDHIIRIMIDVDEQGIQGIQAYHQPISFKKPGTHSIQYYAVNLLGQKGETKEFKVVIEDSLPEINLVASKVGELDGEIFALTDSEFNIEAKDEGIGVEKIIYALNKENLQEYKEPFSISHLSDGKHKIRFKAVDFVGNWSEEKVFCVNIDRTPPYLDINFSKVKERGKLINTLFSSSNRLITLLAKDPSGVSKILFEIDGNGLMEYKEPVLVDVKKSHKLKCRVEDRLGNWQDKEFSLKDWQKYSKR